MTPATRAAQQGAALLDLTGRTWLELTGRDRSTFLHNFCTNDIKSLHVGQGCEAFLCNAKGRVLGHVTVFVGEQALWLETVAGAASKLIPHLERYVIREEVVFCDRSAEVLAWLLVGPQAAELMGTVLPRLVPSFKRTALESLTVPGWWSCGDDMLQGVGRVGWLSQPAWWLVLSPQAATTNELRRQLVQAGAVAGDTVDWEALRIEAGFPEYGKDITEENLPQEVARNAQCLNFRKGCYLGQEPIARLDALGHTNQELRRLRGTGTSQPHPGTVLLDPATQQMAGILTSTAPAPFGEGFVALGYVKRKYFTPGTELLCAEHSVRVLA